MRHFVAHALRLTGFASAIPIGAACGGATAFLLIHIAPKFTQNHPTLLLILILATCGLGMAFAGFLCTEIADALSPETADHGGSGELEGRNDHHNIYGE